VIAGKNGGAWALSRERGAGAARACERLGNLAWLAGLTALRDTGGIAGAIWGRAEALRAIGAE
jgi:hypothetical protein